jgi:hypothetical protein
MNLAELQKKWDENAEAYKTVEIGGGVHDFVNNILSNAELFNLKLTPKKTAREQTYVHDTEAGEKGRPDFVLYIIKNITIPCEVKCFGRITEGLQQLKNYQLDYAKEYGILTDGFEWRFYRANSYQVFTLDKMLANPKDFLTFWENYLKPENYYIELFAPSGQGIFFDEPLDLNDSENRSIFFKDTSKIISNFRIKIKIKDDKTAIETAYAYLIQFILYKVLVDNRFKKFENEYNLFRRQVVEAIRNKDLYNLVVSNIREISEYISRNVYKLFAEEQAAINEKLIADLKRELSIDDIAPWLDIIAFINKYDFANLQNEIFGFVYENYLKDLYGEKNKGQYFTDPDIVNFMMDELGYDETFIKSQPDKISIIDPACGAGTFLYSAVDRIIKALDTRSTAEQAAQIKQLIDKNVFGLDIAEFPLYLAELSILVNLLPLIVNEKFVQPVEHKFKLFKTRDSISEFLDTGITAQEESVDLFTHVQEMSLDYRSFMRSDQDLVEMLRSMQGQGVDRLRFDFIASNPPYIGYNDCCQQGIEFTKKIKDRQNHSISFGNVFGVNLHSVPSHNKKYPPKPNLYVFFIALGLGLLKDGGKLCYIIPQTLLTETDYDVLRYHLANFVTIEKMITFESKMFVGRGLKQNKPITTSSLIIVLQKKAVRKNHKVKIVNYKPYTCKQSDDFAQYLRSRNKVSKEILQSQLQENHLNWNFIKHEAIFSTFVSEYNRLTDSLESYFDHQTAVATYGDRFVFDVGYILGKQFITQREQPDCYELVRFEKDRFQLTTANGYYPTDAAKIKLPKNSQGLGSLGLKYKIVWQKSYGTKKFHFSDRKILPNMSDQQFIASNNRNELLYLMSLLNAKCNTVLFNKLFSVSNEKLGIFIVIKRIKEFIRIPRITSKNQKLKDAIIKKTEAMLALEDVVLRDIVDFAKLNVQHFDSIRVVGNELILTNGKEFKLKIAEEKKELVQKLIREKYLSGGTVTERDISLQELKTLPAIDFAQQAAIKKEIDDLVFALYFDVLVKDVASNEFYEYINGGK